MAHYAVGVIGGGSMGTAAAWELAKRGERAIVWEQFGHVHDQGAHSGQTRVIRHAYAEGAAYIPLVLRADELFLELGEIAGETILHRTGSLEMGAPGYDHAERARASAESYGLPYQWMTAAEAASEWPEFHIPDDWVAGFDPDAGFVMVEPALRTMAAQARASGVEIREHEPVLRWGATADGAWVETAAGRTTVDRLVITAGPWAGRVMADLGLPIEIQRKVLFWLEVERPERFAPDRFPVFISDSGMGEVYGFPVFGQPGFKIAEHSGGEVVDPATVDRTVRPGEERTVTEVASLLFRGVGPRVVKSAVCLYSRTPDTDFILDRHPEWPQVVIGAGFSGHGFKFTPAIGEHLVGLALDGDAAPLDTFRIDRFG